jgi:heme-degrading monooxygenase HmoA
MIERHITFNVHPDKTDALERLFADTYGPTMAMSPGFVKVELLREVAEPNRYQMVTRFEDADKAAGWATSEAHRALQPAMKALYADYELVVYEVIT